MPPSEPRPAHTDTRRDAVPVEDFVGELAAARRSLGRSCRALTDAGADPFFVGLAALYESYDLMVRADGGADAGQFLRVAERIAAGGADGPARTATDTRTQLDS